MSGELNDMSDSISNYIKFYHVSPKDARLPIVQAPATREWMDDTVGGYAYRCLPMAYANRHGWAVCLERDVEVIWYGEINPESTVIVCGREQKGFRMADNGTGNGIVTFHLNAIVRTHPDWNLWIMGAPNLVIPGASALSGVVSTDWAFTSPTSNWKLTEPGKLVTFKAGDPVIFFIPIHKTELETFKVENLEIGDDAEIFRHFKEHSEWRQKMDSQGMEANGKMYRRGVRPDGTTPDFPYNHKTKLTLDAYQDEEQG